jgi:hypothetical protein
MPLFCSNLVFTDDVSETEAITDGVLDGDAKLLFCSDLILTGDSEGDTETDTSFEKLIFAPKSFSIFGHLTGIEYCLPFNSGRNSGDSYSEVKKNTHIPNVEFSEEDLDNNLLLSRKLYPDIRYDFLVRLE